MKRRPYNWKQSARYLAGEMKMNEEIAFKDKWEGNLELVSELETMEKNWKNFTEKPAGKYQDTYPAWNRLYRKMDDDGLLESDPGGSSFAIPMPVLKIAATILLLLAVGIPSIYFGFIRTNEQAAFHNYHSEEGVSTVDLPDGSRVYLNEGATITYPETFNMDRSVVLEGEAFFEVMSDPANPFRVHSGKVMISVLGTSFNVKKNRRGPDVEVFVESGKVRMSMDNSSRTVTLETGQLGVSEAAALLLASQDDPNYIAWKTKDFKFVDVEMSRVLHVLETAYHVVINTGTLEISSMQLTSTYKEQSIDAILETISAAFGLSVEKKEDTYYLTN